MKRDLGELAENAHDVLIIGGGIYGLFAAWDAALRGLSVALVEKGDFGHATSFNSLRVIHGGLRYLQHGDFIRMRESIRERTSLLRTAPHLIHPLPFLIPTYGYGMRGKAALSLALKAHDLVGLDRNRLDDPQKHLPGSWAMSREECLRLFPGMDRRGLTGAAVYFDAQMRASERLVLAILRCAVDAGARPANYVEATGFLTQGNRVTGVSARDVLTGDRLEIRAGVVVNSSGPWIDGVLGLLNGRHPHHRLPLSKAFNLLVNRQLTTSYAFGVYSKDRFEISDVVVHKGSRMFFIIPWSNGSLIGTEHLPYDGEPDGFEVTEEDIQAFVNDINEAYPAAELRRKDVVIAYGGLLPAVGRGAGRVQLVKRYRIHDHRKEQGLDGLISVVGVKFTESRHVAEKAVDLVFRKLGKTPPRCATAVTPVSGGKIDRLDSFLSQEVAKKPGGLDSESVRHLISRYGAAYPEVLEHLNERTGPALPASGLSNLLRAEVVHGVRREMAQRLSDVVFRRTALGIAGVPEDSVLRDCAGIMTAELGWDLAKAEREIEEARRIFLPRHQRAKSLV